MRNGGRGQVPTCGAYAFNESTSSLQGSEEGTMASASISTR